MEKKLMGIYRVIKENLPSVPSSPNSDCLLANLPTHSGKIFTSNISGG